MVMKQPDGSYDPAPAYALYAGTVNDTPISFQGFEINAPVHMLQVVQRL
jgi:hypothetical protein